MIELPRDPSQQLYRFAELFAACHPPPSRVRSWASALKLEALSKPDTALLPIRWKGERSSADLIETHEYVLSSGDGETVLWGHYDAYFEGRFTVVTRVAQQSTRATRRRAPPAAQPWLIEPFATGATADHRHAAQSFFAPGADLAALADAGVRADWSSASFLYAVVRRALRTLHEAKLVHGALSARRIRVRIGRDPYALDRRL